MRREVHAQDRKPMMEAVNTAQRTQVVQLNSVTLGKLELCRTACMLLDVYQTLLLLQVMFA